MGIVKFSKKLKGSQKKEQFVAPDGPHPYIGPDEEIVRKIAEKNTAELYTADHCIHRDSGQ